MSSGERTRGKDFWTPGKGVREEKGATGEGGREENIQNLARLFHGRVRHADESVSNKVLTVSNGETWRTRPRSSTAGNRGRRIVRWRREVQGGRGKEEGEEKEGLRQAEKVS